MANARQFMAARTAAWSEIKPSSQTERYIQDGLVLQIDCVENAGRGLHEDGTTLKNLVDMSDFGNTGDFSVTNESITSVADVTRITGDLAERITDVIKSGFFCYEIVRYFEAAWNFKRFGVQSFSDYTYNACDLVYYPGSYGVVLGGISKVNTGSNTSKWAYGCASANSTSGEGWIDQRLETFTESDSLRWPTGTRYGFVCEKLAPCKTMRWYNRYLSQEEIEFNRSIDRERFGVS